MGGEGALAVIVSGQSNLAVEACIGNVAQGLKGGKGGISTTIWWMPWLGPQISILSQKENIIHIMPSVAGLHVHPMVSNIVRLPSPITGRCSGLQYDFSADG